MLGGGEGNRETNREENGRVRRDTKGGEMGRPGGGEVVVELL